MATDAFVLDQIDDINDRLSVLGFGYKFEEESLVESNDQWKAICSSILSELRQDQTISISDLHTWCESRGILGCFILSLFNIFLNDFDKSFFFYHG